MNLTNSHKSIQLHTYHACNDCHLNNGQVVASVDDLGLFGCSLTGKEAEGVCAFLDGKRIFSCNRYQGITGYFAVAVSRHEVKKKKKGRR